MFLPSLSAAEALLRRAQERNPTPWVDHSNFVARAAEAIASQCGDLDPAFARVVGLLHDIGRQEGVTGMRHALDGYRFLSDLGYDDAAQVCLTHSFPMEDMRESRTSAGSWDCTAAEIAFVDDYLAHIKYSDYDRLIQLCDTLALPSGFCSLEERFVDVVLRHGFNEFTVRRWRACLGLRDYFEEKMGQRVADVLATASRTYS